MPRLSASGSSSYHPSSAVHLASRAHWLMDCVGRVRLASIRLTHERPAVPAQPLSRSKQPKDCSCRLDPLRSCLTGCSRKRSNCMIRKGTVGHRARQARKPSDTDKTIHSYPYNPCRGFSALCQSLRPHFIDWVGIRLPPPVLMLHSLSYGNSCWVNKVSILFSVTSD